MNRQSPPNNDGNEAHEASHSSVEERRIAVKDHRIDSRDLFVATKEIVIAHGADLYRLRLTAQNKLILTK